MDQSYPSTIKQGTELFRVPTMEECREFNKAADEWLMKRGVFPSSSFSRKNSKKSDDSDLSMSEVPDAEEIKKSAI